MILLKPLKANILSSFAISWSNFCRFTYLLYGIHFSAFFFTSRGFVFVWGFLV